MITTIRALEKAMGVATLELSAKSMQSRTFARSLYVVDKVEQGDVFTDENVRSIRPSLGLPPKHYKDVIGKTATQAVGRGTALSWAHVNVG
jgi:pseudaminic acid synthase